MKKTAFFCGILVLLLIILTACSCNLTDRADIVRLYQQHEAAFAAASESGDFAQLKKISGVQEVYVQEDYVNIVCGGSGFGSSTHYYGIFYSSSDDLCAVDVAGPSDELVKDGDGYRYRQKDGDNEYYAEPLGHHYFYYEAHF